MDQIHIKKIHISGPILAATLPDKQHSLWLHGNTLLKPMHSVTAPNASLASEYAEVTQIMPKLNPMSVPSEPYGQPEPYATVNLISSLILLSRKKLILFNLKLIKFVFFSIFICRNCR